MPRTEKERRAAAAEIRRREKGGKRKLFSSMSTDELKRYLKESMHQNQH